MPLKVFVSLILCLSLGFFSHASGSGFGLTPPGSKAVSLGSNFIGLADDWSAAFWNPAGLAYLKNSEFAANLRGVSYRNEYIPDILYGTGTDTYPVGYQNNITWFPDDQSFYLPSFSGFYKFKTSREFTAGLSFFMPYALNSKWKFFKPLEGYDNDVPTPEVDHQFRLYVLDFHPSIAREISKGKLAFGLGINIQKADFNYRKMELLPDSIVVNHFERLPRPYDNFLMDNKVDLSGWGYGFNLGLLYKHSPKFQVGVSFQSPITLNLKGDNHLTLIYPENSGIANQYPNLAPYFSGGSSIRRPDLEMELKLPSIFGIGLAYFPSAKWTLSADLVITGWSRLDETEYEYTDNSDTDPLGVPVNNSEILPEKIVWNWDNTTRIGLGASYQIFEKWNIRSGYFHESSPMPDETFTPVIPDINDKNSWSLGLAFRFLKYEVSYNYELVSFSTTKVTQLKDVDNDGRYDNFPGRYTNRQHSSQFLFSYRF